MKISLVYGLGLSIVGALTILVLYFLGIHNDVEKMVATNAVVQLVSGFIVPVVGLVLALRATRTAAGDSGMSYGKGVLTSLLVGVFAGLFSAVFIFVYGTMINPGWSDTIHEMQIAQMEAQGKLTSEQIEQAAPMMKKFTSPLFFTIATLFGSPIFYTLFGLIVSIFFRRAPVAAPPAPPAASSAS